MAIYISKNWPSAEEYFVKAISPSLRDRIDAAKDNLPVDVFSYLCKEIDNIIIGRPADLRRHQFEFQSVVEDGFNKLLSVLLCDFISDVVGSVSLDGGNVDISKYPRLVKEKKLFLSNKIDGVSVGFSCFRPLSLGDDYYKKKLKDCAVSALYKIYGQKTTDDCIRLALEGEFNFSFSNSKSNKILQELYVEYNKALREFLLGVFNYDGVVGDWGYKLCDFLNVRVCPYCNLSFTHHAVLDDGKFRPDFEHFYPKSTYPILSLSLYNLIPACKVCNSIKRSKNFLVGRRFHPLEDGSEISFSINLPIDTIWNELESVGSCKAMKVEVDCSQDSIGCDSVNDLFLAKRYEFLNDEAVEIFCRMLEYERNSTAKSLRIPVLDMALRGVNNGNYKDRIMGKLILDMAKKVGILKSS